MKTRALFVALLTSLALHAGASPTDVQTMAAANNTFSFSLLKQIAADEPNKNIFVSPYSASTALQMTANGAAGRTKTEMENVLGTGTTATGLSDIALNQANKEISQFLHDGNTNVILEIANAIWCRKGAPIKPDFLTCNRDYFGATVAPLDFANPRAADIVNQWASEKTHGRIPHIVDSEDLDNCELFLANAVYFKGKWLNTFDASDTHTLPFHRQDGSQKLVRMMKQSGTFTYRRGTGYQAVRLPYQGDNLAMYVFLPDAGSSPEKLLDIMTGDTWRRITKPGFANEEGELELPKFKLNYTVELSKPLQKLGMATAFDQAKANFSGMSPEPLYISAALQSTFVEVKEEGTEAAAVTGIAVHMAAMPEPPPKQFEMKVNRPFLFLIEDNSTETILFMGVIYDPPPDE
jgi:serine protease inhibitor